VAAITGKSDRSRIEVILDDGAVTFDVWFNPGNPLNIESIDNIDKAVNSYYAKSDRAQDIAKVARKIRENFDRITDPGTTETIMRYDTSDDYNILYAVIKEMSAIMEKYAKDREQAVKKIDETAAPFMVVHENQE
jgi:hypothetical protein